MLGILGLISAASHMYNLNGIKSKTVALLRTFAEVFDKGINNQYVGEDKCILEGTNLIRRLTPLECERLQGFPDHWTDIPGASDSARYKALGNSVAIPCVDFVVNGMAAVLREQYCNAA